MREQAHRLVFIDETATTTKMTRLRGRALHGQTKGPRSVTSYMATRARLTRSTAASNASQTEFNLAPAQRFYGQPYAPLNSYCPAYESAVVATGTAVGTSVRPDDGVSWALPMLFHT